MADTYQTSIAGFDLDVETLSDGFQKAIAKHEFPNTNGALLEDMGQKGRAISIRCYFGVSGGVASYDDYFEFIKILDDISTIELIHPEDGLLKGRIEKVDKRKNDRLEFAEVDITFLEGRIEVEVQSEISMPGFGEETFLDALLEQQTQCVDDITEDLGTEGASAAAKALDASQGILAQFSSLSGKVRAYVAQVESGVATLEATLVLVTQPANTLLATVTYAANLPGRIIGAVAQTVERYAESYNALRGFPAQFQRSLKFSLNQLEASFRSFRSKAPAGSSRNLSETAAMTLIANHINLATANRLALEAAYGFSNDQTERLLAKKNEGQKSFDILGNYSAPVSPGPIMTQNEIEATLASVMTAAQESIDLMRGAQAIKRGVSGLVTFARIVKIDAAKIKQVDIDGTLPLHLILPKYGLPYNAAERVLAINPQIKHPSFVSGTVNIYVS
jgi:prophage DNA circulation protein